MRELAKAFVNLIDARTVIAGIGNILKGDDAAGLSLLDGLRGKTKAELIDCGVSPENYLEKIAALGPSTIILLDAAELGEPPGSMQLFNADEVQIQGFSTHNFSLDLLSRYFRNRVNGVKIHILGIQPQNCGLRHGLSEVIKKAIEQFLGDIGAAGNRLEQDR